MESPFSYLTKWLGMSGVVPEKLFASAYYLAAIWILRFLLLKLIFKTTDSTSGRYVARKTISIIAVIVSIICLSVVWFELLDASFIVTYLGFLSAGLAIALKDLLANVVGWLYLVLGRPIEVGDRITINEITGDVIDISLTEIVIVEIGNWVEADQSTGRIVFIPNGWVFSKSLFNYSKGFNFIWEDMGTTVTFESDWKKAKEIVSEVVSERTRDFVSTAEKDIKKASSKFFVMYKNLTPIVYTSIVDFGVKLSIRYVVPPRKRRNTSQAIWEDILKRFKECKDIDFAYPTYRTYYNLTEGKEPHQIIEADKNPPQPPLPR